MPKSPPSTPAVLLLKSRGIPYTEHRYRYEEHGGTTVAARELQVPEHAVVKTLVMEDDAHEPLVVLMHGDREVSTKSLARQAGRRSISPCKPDVATRHTGYLVGGTSPFGTRKRLPVFMERTILDLPTAFINGGSRGFLLGVTPESIVDILQPQLVDVAIQG
jgi:Cys-tRNA(Pro) deacylase